MEKTMNPVDAWEEWMKVREHWVERGVVLMCRKVQRGFRSLAQYLCIPKEFMTILFVYPCFLNFGIFEYFYRLLHITIEFRVKYLILSKQGPLRIIRWRVFGTKDLTDGSQKASGIVLELLGGMVVRNDKIILVSMVDLS